MPKEIGASNANIFEGYIDEEYNPDLKFPKNIKIYEQMRKSDAMIYASLQACKRPILSADYKVESGSEEKKDIDIADFVDKNFGISGESFSENIIWRDFLQHLLLIYDFGFSIFEIVFSKYENFIVYDKFAPRLQNTIENFSEGGKKGVKQYANKDPFGSKGSIEDIFIPWDKVFHIAYEQEGENLIGNSLLRSIYQNWYYKKGFLAV